MALTDALIKGLKPKDGVRSSKADSGGLLLDVTPGGVKSWVFRYRLDGKREKVVIGRYPDVSLKEARAERDKLAAVVQSGKSPFEAKKQKIAEAKLKREGKSADPTVAEFAERYYKEQVIPNWKDPKHIRRYIDKEIVPAIGSIQLNKADALDVQKLVYRKRDNGQVQAAIQLRGVIKRMFDYAIETRLVTLNPAAMVATRYIGKARARQRVLTASEIRIYLRTIYQSNIRRQFKLALHIILLTMVRKAPLLLARWNEIDFESGEWRIPKEHMKGKKGEEREHIVYMSTQVAGLFRELKALAGDSDLVLPGRGRMSKPFAKNALNKALEGLTFEGMDPLTIHDLRRTAASLLSDHGHDRDVVEKAMSHQKEGIRKVYIVAEYAEQRNRMLQWWGDYLESIMTEAKVIEGNFRRAAG